MDVSVDAAMSALLLVSAAMPATVCMWTGTLHTRAPDALAGALRQLPTLRRALSPPAARMVARAWGLVEATSGIAVLAALVSPVPASLRFGALLWMTVMYVGFASWLVILRRRVPAATCGCGTRAEPADGLALLRTGVLSACAAVPMLSLLAGLDPVVPPYRWLFLPVAATLALLLWLLPVAVRTMGDVS